MAHAFLKPETLVNASLGTLERELVLTQFLWRDAEAYFTGATGPKGDKISIRVPGRMTEGRELAWRTSARTIITDDIKEGSIDVILDTYAYKAVDLLDEELTLDVEPFGDRVLRPMTQAVAEHIENKIATFIQSTTFVHTVEIALTGERRVYNALIKARGLLNRSFVPRADRICIMGSNLEEIALQDPSLVDVDRSGSTAALRDASIGRIAGFEIFGSDNIDPDEMYVFHRTAFPAVFRAPKPARGVAFSSSATFNGLALTYWEDYNSVNASDRAFVGTFFGLNRTLDPVDLTDPAGAKHFVRGVKLILDTTP